MITAVHRSRRSNGRGDPCSGRGGFADAGRPCWTVWHCQPPRAHRLAAAGQPDYQPSLARPLPPLARRIARQCLPPVGRRRPAAGRPQTVPAADRPPAASAGRAALSADAAAASRRPEPDDRASQCSHTATAVVDRSRLCLSRMTVSCGHRPGSD